MCVSIRSTDMNFETKGNIEACSHDIGLTVPKMTYKYLMSPMLEGKYHIVNVATGEYLGGIQERRFLIGPALSKKAVLVNKSKWNNRDKVWYINKAPGRMPDRMPVFTLTHRKTGLDILQNTNATVDHVWQFERADDGENWYMVKRAVDPAVDENRKEYFKADESKDSDWIGFADAPDGPGALWKLQYVPSVFDRVNVQAWFKLLAMQKHSSVYNYNKFLSPEVSYKVQLKMGLSYPIWEGSKVRWYDLCKGDDKQGGLKIDVCLQFYSDEREFLVDTGKVEENTTQVTFKTGVRGICDAQRSMFAYFLHQPKLLYYLSKDNLDSCYGLADDDLSLAAQMASVDTCYQDCMDAIDSQAEQSLLCYKMKQVNQSHLFETIIDASPQCAELPFTVLEGLVDFKLKQKCWTFAPPTPLWLTNDMDMNFGNSACDADSSFWRRTARVSKGSTCPSGSTCSCPGPSVYPKTAAEIRGEESTMFITDGSAGSISVSKVLGATFAKAVIKKMIVKGKGFSGKGFSYSAKAAVMAPLTIYKVGRIMLPEMIRSASWRCDLTVGCWPSSPRRHLTTGKCRAKDSVQKGNSGPTWMMPPPGLKFSKKFMRCVLTSCSASEKAFQQIGFSDDDNSEVYNCQPLSFEEMKPKQQYLYLSTLFYTDVASEYDLSQALQNAREAAMLEGQVH